VHVIGHDNISSYEPGGRALPCFNQRTVRRRAGKNLKAVFGTHRHEHERRPMGHGHYFMMRSASLWKGRRCHGSRVRFSWRAAVPCRRISSRTAIFRRSRRCRSNALQSTCGLLLHLEGGSPLPPRILKKRHFAALVASRERRSRKMLASLRTLRLKLPMLVEESRGQDFPGGFGSRLARYIENRPVRELGILQ